MNSPGTDEKAKTLAELVQRESKRVHAVCYRITRNPEMAAEAFQETFLRLARWMRSLGERPVPDASSLAGLVQVLAERSATDVLRKHIRIAGHEASDEPAGSYGEPALADGVDFDRLMERLSPREREVLEFGFVHGYSSHEIAALMKLSAVAVRVIKSRALNRLREELGAAKKVVTDGG